MLLNNLQLVNTNKVIDIQVAGKHIAKVANRGCLKQYSPLSITFQNAVVLPGLINSHDHLDFNLFPQLGNQVYKNYTEWASAIHQKHRDEIAAVLCVPEELRVQWGIYKNLLCGVTTVVNHGKALAQKDHLITVIESAQCLHSVGFENKLKLKLNNPLRVNKPVAIHTGEGTDEFAANEIDQLIKWNLLKRKLVGIHGVAMTIDQAKKFKALVWCPASNYFLLNETANINRLRNYTTICFGSDSTLTSDWNIWKHIRLALAKTGISVNELLKMLTVNPAGVWKLNGGAIEEGRDADIVVAKNKNDGCLADINPEEILLVIHKGDICLFDDCLYHLLEEDAYKQGFSVVEINNSIKHVKGNLLQLTTGIKHYFRAAPLPFKTADRAAALREDESN